MRWLPLFQQADPAGAGSPPAGQGGTGSTPANGQDPNAPPAWAQDMLGGINKLGETLEGIFGMAKSGREEAERRRREAQEAAEAAAAAAAAPNENDLETIPRAKFAEFIIGEVAKQFGTVVKPIENRLNQTTFEIAEERVREEMKGLRKDHPDFDEWKQEMLTIAEQHKGLTPTRYYQLARLDNPKKMDELEKKYKLGKYAEQETGPRNGASRLPFGGMAPGGASGSDRNRKMKPKDATEAGWAEAVRQFGGVPNFE